MPQPKISEAEWEVMEVLWTQGPLSSTDIVLALQKRSTWSSTTIRTLLARLAKKKLLAAEKRGGLLFYRPLATRGQCAGTATRRFLDQVWGGSLAPLLLHFAEHERIDPQELKQLKKLINGKERK
jgi:BlaI family penicillinase repressor